jgi:hypothetical protein
MATSVRHRPWRCSRPFLFTVAPCVALTALLLMGPGSAAPSRLAASTESRFLTSRPIGPLAIVRGGVIETPGSGACRSWGPVGSRWYELDAFGRVTGLVAIQGRSYYDYSDCDELSVRPVSGRRGVGVFVDARAVYQAPRVLPWRPTAGLLTALEETVRLRQRGILDLNPRVHVPFERRAFFFEWSASGVRHAVVGGRSLIVLSLRDDRWIIEYEQKPPKMRSQDEGFKVLAVTDMNADGRPEIIVHQEEELGEWYVEFTLSLGADRRWRTIDAGIFGSTA